MRITSAEAYDEKLVKVELATALIEEFTPCQILKLIASPQNPLYTTN